MCFCIWELITCRRTPTWLALAGGTPLPKSSPPWRVLVVVALFCWYNEFEQRYRLRISPSMLCRPCFTLFGIFGSKVKVKSWRLRFCVGLFSHNKIVIQWSLLLLKRLIKSFLKLTKLSHWLELWQILCSLLFRLQHFAQCFYLLCTEQSFLLDNLQILLGNLLLHFCLLLSWLDIACFSRLTDDYIHYLGLTSILYHRYIVSALPLWSCTRSNRCIVWFVSKLGLLIDQIRRWW